MCFNRLFNIHILFIFQIFNYKQYFRAYTPPKSASIKIMQKNNFN
ncbi:hypothetical protein HMPREF9075_01078 [Capnocytophaga sp. oral taxon 332 str. F0381]|nr:hypothetical protein HMPREF9075_01078 [Capnocytophaga sp. oral taxon 332 str. F0381]